MASPDLDPSRPAFDISGPIRMLRYSRPAESWNEALPVGNGRLGAMVWGGVHTETLHLNEESVWYGGPQSRTPVGAKKYLPEVRALIRAGRQRDAETLVRERFFATPRSARHYEPLGICKIGFDYGLVEGKGVDAADYERTSDLNKAEVGVTFNIGGVKVQREVIASHQHACIAMRVRAERAICYTISLTRMSDVAWEVNEFLDSIDVVEDYIFMHATPGGKNSTALCLAAGAKCDPAGRIGFVGKTLRVTAKESLIVLAANTQWRHMNVQQATLDDLEAALNCTPSELWARHYHAWKHDYGRMSLELHPEDTSLNTDQRLQDNRDPGLVASYVNYARYLLLSSSKPGFPPYKALPATLQGIWNPLFQPPWGSKFTVNINLQMNYWAAHVLNLSECEMPLFDLLERMAVNGTKTASEVYGCRGWCAHHNTDIFADTETQDEWMAATLWPLGGAWLCTHVYEHYLFTQDIALLKRMLPVMRGCVEFLIDFLIRDESGRYLVTSPSLSPENTFIHVATGEKGVFCEGSTIDTEIVRQVLSDYLSITKILGITTDPDAFLIAPAKSTLDALPPLIISPTTSTIQEWGLNDHAETEPGHRHISHLYPLYPGKTITPTSTPELAAATRRTLERRLQNGGGHTGWSRAWLICMWARLRSPVKCVENIEALLKDSTLPNLLDTHPPFQIDGNFGGAAGVMECLIQSHETEKRDAGKQEALVIRLLPSCPKQWVNGNLRGVKCRGGFEVAFNWENGKIKEPVEVTNGFEKRAVLILHEAGTDAADAGIRIEVPMSKGVHKLYIR